MTSRDFCYWLQGHFELSGTGVISAGQVEVIKTHLAMVFAHEIDPSMGGKTKQSTLDAIHAGGKIGGEIPTAGGVVKYRC